MQRCIVKWHFKNFCVLKNICPFFISSYMPEMRGICKNLRPAIIFQMQKNLCALADYLMGRTDEGR